MRNPVRKSAAEREPLARSRQGEISCPQGKLPGIRYLIFQARKTNGLVLIFGSSTPLRTFRFYAKSGSQIRRRARTACEVAARRDFLPAGQLPGWQLSCISGNANKRVGLNFWKSYPTSDVSRKRETRFANPPQSANRLRGRGKARFPACRATSGWQLSYVSGKENKRVGLYFWKFHPISDVSHLCEIRFATSRKKPTSYWFLRADFCLNFLKNLANTQSIRRGFFVVQPKILSAKTMLILNHTFFITTRVQLFTACPRASRLRGRGKARFPARRANFRVGVVLHFRQSRQMGGLYFYIEISPKS